ncbi:MAG: protein kinase [Myxococcaceae bacterium]
MVVGTPAYMSPEQIRGQGIGDRSDIYSMGVVAWELLTGKVPFDAPSLVDVMRLHLDAILPTLPPNLGVPTALESLLVKMLQKRPTDRPSAQAVAREAQAVRRFFNIAPTSEATELQERPSWAKDGSDVPTASMPPIPSWVGTGALSPPKKSVEPVTDRSLPPMQPLPETIKMSPSELRAKVAAVAPAAAPVPVSAMTIRDPVPVIPEPRSRKPLLIGVAVMVLLAVALTIAAVVLRWLPAHSHAAQKAPIEVAPPPPPKGHLN